MDGRAAAVALRGCTRGRVSLGPLSRLVMVWGRLWGGRVHHEPAHRLLVVTGMRGGTGAAAPR